MTGQRYIDEVLLPHVRLLRGAIGDKFVFMDNNATCHRTLTVQDCLDREGIERLVWPARSPDLNTIENVWDALGRQVAGRNFPPTNKNTLIRALTEEWDKLPQQLLDNVVQKLSVTWNMEVLRMGISENLILLKGSSLEFGKDSKMTETSVELTLQVAMRTSLQWSSVVLFPSSSGLACTLITSDLHMENARYPLPPRHDQ
ncbi:transposable element Tc3 transposase [Trichonephila clavipes]|nr:transposable element Tc3 transposase [Trichonephila clavipes]